MLKINADGEKFSEDCAYRVLGVIAKNKKCAIKDACLECGISKMTAGRVFRMLENEGLIKKYPYRAYSGRGARPTHYVLNPKTVCAVLDLRRGIETLSLVFPPRFRKIVIAPRIASSKDLSEKRELLMREFSERLPSMVSEKHLISVSVITNDKEDAEKAVPAGSFIFSVDELEALWAKELLPDSAVMIVKSCENDLKISVCLRGERVASETVGLSGDKKYEAIARLCREGAVQKIFIFSPRLSLASREETEKTLHIAGVATNVDVSFSDYETFDPAQIAARLSLDRVTRWATEKALKIKKEALTL